MVGNNNFYDEKMGIIKFIRKQVETNVDNPKELEYVYHKSFQLFT